MSQDLLILKPRTFTLSDIWSGGGIPSEYTRYVLTEAGVTYLADLTFCPLTNHKKLTSS